MICWVRGEWSIKQGIIRKLTKVLDVILMVSNRSIYKLHANERS